MKQIVFLLEEISARDLLEGLLPKLLPSTVQTHFLVFEGKQDLEKQLVRKIRGWRAPNSCFVVMRDQDAGDCRVIKKDLENLGKQCVGAEVLVRILLVANWNHGYLATGMQSLPLLNDQN